MLRAEQTRGTSELARVDRRRFLGWLSLGTFARAQDRSVAWVGVGCRRGSLVPHNSSGSHPKERWLSAWFQRLRSKLAMYENLALHETGFAVAVRHDV